jgi:hypothetical protein
MGHIRPDDGLGSLRPDRNLMLAENEVIRRSLTDPHCDITEQRDIVKIIQKSLLIFGIGDVVCSSGERDII